MNSVEMCSKSDLLFCVNLCVELWNEFMFHRAAFRCLFLFSFYSPAIFRTRRECFKWLCDCCWFCSFLFFFPCSFSFTLIFSGWLEYRNSVKIGTGLVNAMKIHIFIVELRSEKQQRERQRDRAQRKMYIFTVISSYLFTFTVCVVSTLCLAFFDVCELFVFSLFISMYSR